MWWVKRRGEVGRLRPGLRGVLEITGWAEDWRSTYRLVGLGPLDQDLQTLGSHEDVTPSGVPRGVELGSRWRHQVRLPEHGEETKGEEHPQGRTEDPRLGVMEQSQWSSGGRNGKMSQGYCLHGDVGHPEQAGHLEGFQDGWSETHLLVEHPDSGDIVASAACNREKGSEVGDVQAHGGDV